MERKAIELNTFKPKDGQKYQIIHITDIMLHTAMKRSTSAGKKIKEAMETGKPGRVYSPVTPTDINNEQKTFAIQILQTDPEFVQMVHDYEAKGYKVLLSFPKEGIPIFAGEDTKEFMESTKGKRVIRRLAKEE